MSSPLRELLDTIKHALDCHQAVEHGDGSLDSQKRFSDAMLTARTTLATWEENFGMFLATSMGEFSGLEAATVTVTPADPQPADLGAAMAAALAPQPATAAETPPDVAATSPDQAPAAEQL